MTEAVQVGGEITNEYVPTPGMAIVEHDIQQDPYIEKNPDKKWFLTVDVDKGQLEKLLDELDEAMKDFVKEYDIPNELFNILKQDGLMAFGKALAQEDMDTFYAWWMIMVNVSLPFLGQFISKQGLQLAQLVESKIGKGIGKGLGFTGNVLSFLPLLFYAGRTVYDDFFQGIRYMGTTQENVGYLNLDILGLLSDLFLLPGGISEKALSIIINGLFILVDGITAIYNYVEGLEQQGYIQEWHDQTYQEIQNFQEQVKKIDSFDNLYVDFL